eukprot:TRINITY_DN33021_c0_g1_i10.p1 TRINITY_DN33021_c0_g1~~TRINITY_DN33021_c0_g1_i10.p1  ORF type:complete len:133 (+),score=20.02 TRINITY_DN33021_c0_g1_i10:373-771(+)
MAESKAEMAKKWLEDRANPAHSTVVGNLAIGGLQVFSAQTGRILCNFLLPRHLSDKDGNWRAGAIATLIDNVGSLAIASATGDIKISVAFDISYFSTVKINVRCVDNPEGTGLMPHCGSSISALTKGRGRPF